MVNVGIRPYVWMLSGCVWFSIMGLLAHSLKKECDWQAVALARSGLATLFALSIALGTGAKLVFFKPRVLWVRSVAGSCSMLATFYALTRLPVSEVLTLTNTFPIWVALLSWPMAGERPTVGVIVAVLCSVVGVAFAQQPHLDGFPLAAWAALAASLFTAVAMLGLNRLQGVSSLGVVVHFSGVSTLFCGFAFLALDRVTGTDRIDEIPVLFKLLAVGVTATIGQVFLTRAFRAGSATKVSVVTLSQVVMVMVYEAIVDGREFNLLTLLGTALVLGPTGWLMVRERKKPTPPGVPAVEQVAIE